MAIKMMKAVIQDSRHIETKHSLAGVRRGQEIDIFIRLQEITPPGNKKFAFSDHDFGQWSAGQMRREEIYNADSR